MAQQEHQIVTRPAPTGGLNARDGLAAMPEMDAVQLVNWMPDTGGLRCRKGYSEWAINLDGEVEGIASYFTPATVFPGGAFLSTPTSMPGKLFAATQVGIYDITDSTDAPPMVQALSDTAHAGWLSSVMFTNSGGSFLLVASEQDGYFVYDGTTWSKVTLGGGSGQVSGTDPASFCHVSVWKRKVWFVVKNTTKAVYLPTDQLFGAATTYDFGPLFKHGGHLAYLANWTIDAGEGIDDFLIAVSSNGDVCVFKGSDPSSISTFGLVGTWFVGQIPVGRRAYMQYGGDLVLASADGIFPISYVTRGGAEMLVASSKEYSSKIRPLIGQDLRASFTERGWQMIVHPGERVAIVGVPHYAAVQKKQYALSTSLNEWCEFSAIPGYVYGTTSGFLFAGTRDGRVLLALNGFFDNVAYGESTGDGIQGSIVPAFSSFGAPGLTKGFLMVRANFVATDTPSILVDICVDYRITTPEGAVPYVEASAARWNTALWNSAQWAGGKRVFAEWSSVGDDGFAGTVNILTNVVGDTVLASVDYMFKVGGPL